jgi:hypothetical protein
LLFEAERPSAIFKLLKPQTGQQIRREPSHGDEFDVSLLFFLVVPVSSVPVCLSEYRPSLSPQHTQSTTPLTIVYDNTPFYEANI